jgi:hypothetical protein
MPKPDLPLSRQALWQRKHKAMGLCIQCSRRVFRSFRCKRHYELHKLKQRLRHPASKRGRQGGVTDELLRARIKKLSNPVRSAREATAKPRARPKRRATSSRST